MQVIDALLQGERAPFTNPPVRGGVRIGASKHRLTVHRSPPPTPSIVSPYHPMDYVWWRATIKKRLKALCIVAYGIAIGIEHRNEAHAASPHNSDVASRQYSKSILFITNSLCVITGFKADVMIRIDETLGRCPVSVMPRCGVSTLCIRDLGRCPRLWCIRLSAYMFLQVFSSVYFD